MMTTLSLAVTLAFCVVISSGHNHILRYLPMANDRGVVTSCGPPESNFTLEWEPKNINPNGNISVYYDYTIPYDFTKGELSIALYFDNIPDPIFQDTLMVDCQIIRKYVPLCPMTAGKKLKGKYHNSNLLMLKGYDGTYKAKLSLKNEKGKIMFCAMTTATILP